MSAVRDAAVVVTSRYHAALLAVAAGVPVLADVRQAKLASLAATDDLESHIIGFDSWDEVGPAALTCWPCAAIVQRGDRYCDQTPRQRLLSEGGLRVRLR